ncbi:MULTISPECIES: MetQ/NlpA family ABC transporter substrate-binding protein [Paraburkholderia]|jgi:D-methionine transport system substrate-binding protein|uniref:Lipoprotein n=1 Tax=Paraburkholderia hospita TaxID=169430 RepID=A0AAN1J5P5_9BURK|nr:MetQ/NlpA family ABC transporter substrate-binding protein [Paraburkholderia hospita]SOE54890.1 D-methionine transport system substrate-binding protein [Burkholderia sp. YR290]AUT67632.1 MetQ/NlpA family ABC transporter substrate-binding protein [Paraburkholderia hospita]OUL77396.1 metal ABC transporter substrate-binding protein [Paraburkholderia hospita]SEI24597.1 D-methionine transport system substrate-binding protein [Paraburkholderia hospita]SKC77544.1 D-methionine transport system subs
MQRRFILKAAAVLGAASLIGASSLAFADESIKVGVTGGPHAQLMDVVKSVAAKNGLNIKVIEFSDYVQPNAALAGGDLDANSYQHDPYLQAQVKDRGYKLIKIADTVTFPMGIYSKKVKTLAELPAGAKIAVPNDPTNGGRALLLLQKQGLIKLRADAGLKATPLDIVENPKKLKIVELDAAQIPRSLGDVDAAAINTNFAMEAGLKPKQDAIAIEDPKGPYVNVIAIREADRNKPWVAKLIAAYHSPEVKQFIESKFGGAVIASW